MILKIQNKVKSIPSVELLRLLGASSSRGVQENIGQFGSGFPYMLAVVARDNVEVFRSLKVCMGKDVFTYDYKIHETKDSRGETSKHAEIVMVKQNGPKANTGIDIGFGALDWTSVTMGVRELISNAIDGSRSFDGTTNHVTVELLPDSAFTRAKDGYITVYMKTTPEIERYVRDLHKYFICLLPEYTGKKVLVNYDGGPARVYRKGVLVGEFGNKSLFHYDLSDINLKESRNVDSYEAKQRACQAIMRGSDESIMKVFIDGAILNREDSSFWESEFSEYDIKWNNIYATEQSKKTWKSAVHASVGDSVIAENDVAARMVVAKGKRVIRVAGDIAKALEAGGLKSSAQVLDVHELQGNEIVPATANTVQVFNRVWNTCEGLGVTLSKSKPGCFGFVQNTISEGAKFGYYDNGNIYIRSDISEDHGANLLQTVIEEVSHHITGASDMTRDFQDFAFKLVALMMLNK